MKKVGPTGELGWATKLRIFLKARPDGILIGLSGQAWAKIFGSTVGPGQAWAAIFFVRLFLGPARPENMLMYSASGGCVDRVVFPRDLVGFCVHWCGSKSESSDIRISSWSIVAALVRSLWL
jgi:hypothetical protein